MKSLYYLIIFLFFLQSCDYETNTEDAQPIAVKEVKSYDKSRRDSNSVVMITHYYDDGLKESEFTVDTSTKKKEGLARLYYKNRNLKQEGNWHNDKQEGLWRFYYEDGSISSEIYFKNDYQDSLSTFYNEKGSVIEKSNWKNGKLNGQSVTYYDNGEIKKTTNWVNGNKLPN